MLLPLERTEDPGTEYRMLSAGLSNPVVLTEVLISELAPLGSVISTVTSAIPY
jgi:hypothetical protein